MQARGTKRTRRGLAAGGLAFAVIASGGAATQATQASASTLPVPAPMLYVGDVRVTEGEFGSAVARVPITISAPLPADAYFRIETQDDGKGGATPDTDYKPRHLEKRLPAGATSMNVSVPILGDAQPEALEQLIVRVTPIQTPRMAVIKETGNVQIVDDDGGPSGTDSVLSASATRIFEGDATKRSVPVTFRLSRAQATDVVVTWKAVGDSAAPGSDYKSMARSTVIRAGRVGRTINVPMYDDQVAEADEQMRVVITGVTSGSGPSISSDPMTGMVFMVDDDADTDADGLADVAERYAKTDPNVADSDGDGLPDGDEVRMWMTNPNQVDTDGDGFGDLYEVKGRTDPLDPNSYPDTTQF